MYFLFIGSLTAITFAAAVLNACGVKGPPLPPIPDTPEQSDRLERSPKCNPKCNNDNNAQGSMSPCPTPSTNERH